ncbi:MAG: hypothetical protein E7E64_00695 [Clostridium celatum]|nr:hypothetical protein [Clostridium celatum]MDU2121044.1 hypothetical protein [Clostridium celatum]MDU4978944.1 hypothetical protein [Clostridium celatum]
MKKIISKRIFTTILSVFILSLVISNVKVSASKNDVKYDLNISYGIDGRYKALKYMPVTVQINSLEKDFNGEVEVRVTSDSSGGYNAYSKEVSASKGENISVTIPVKFSGENSNGVICIIENGKVLYEKKLLISSGRINEGNAFTGLLTDDPTALGYLGNITYFDSNYSNTGKMNCVNITEGMLDENGLNIDGLDVIIINNYNMANLNDKQYNALNNWVNAGGTLLIGAGANESKTINNINKSFLNIISNGTREQNVKTGSESLNLILSQITLEDSTVTVNSDENKLVYSLDRGAGKILITAFDLGLEPFISSDDAAIMLQDILRETFDKIYADNYQGGYNSRNYEISNILGSIPVENTVSTLTLVIVLGVYAILVGIVIYIILKKMKKRDLTWVLIPVTSIVFTVMIYLLGSKMKIKDIIVNSTNIISVDEDGRGQINSYIGIASKNKENIKIENEEDLKMQYISDDYYYYGDTDYNAKTLRVKTTYTNDNSYFTVSNSDVASVNKFEVSGKEIVMPKLENTLKIKDGNLEGTIKNNLDADIQRLVIVSGKSVWDLGQVAKGEEISITNLVSNGSFGIQGYANSLNDEYYQSRWDDEIDSKDPKFKNVKRHASLLTLLGDTGYVGTTTKIIAITDLPVDYSLNLEGKSISNYNLTAVIQEANIDFKDESGNLSFPEGYFDYTVSELDNRANYDYYNGYIYGEGEVVLDYKIDDNVNIKEININVCTDQWGYQYGLDGEYYIYNYNTNQYEEFKLTSGSYELINDGRYSLDNIIKIKVVASENTEGAAPKLVIKGVEK